MTDQREEAARLIGRSWVLRQGLVACIGQRATVFAVDDDPAYVWVVCGSHCWRHRADKVRRELAWQEERAAAAEPVPNATYPLPWRLERRAYHRSTPHQSETDLAVVAANGNVLMLWTGGWTNPQEEALRFMVDAVNRTQQQEEGEGG